MTNHRHNIYKLLSECFKTPDENLSGYLSNLRESVEVAYPDIFKKLSPEFTASEDIEKQKVEHARLFIGPFELLVPPYGSLYLEGEEQLMTNSTVDVLRRFKEENIDVAIHEMPDHICIELEYMYYLVYKEMQALELNKVEFHKNGSGDTLENSDLSVDKKSSENLVFNYRFKQYDFLNKHLSRWIPEFEEKVNEHAKLQLYKDLAKTARYVIAEDLKVLTNELLE